MKEHGPKDPNQLSFIKGGLIPGELRQFKIRTHRTRRDSPGLTRGSRQTVLRNLPRDSERLPQDPESKTHRPCCFDHNIPMTWVPLVGSEGRWVCPECPGD